MILQELFESIKYKIDPDTKQTIAYFGMPITDIALACVVEIMHMELCDDDIYPFVEPYASRGAFKRLFGAAKVHPDDEYDETYGKILARRRLLNKYIVIRNHIIYDIYKAKEKEFDKLYCKVSKYLNLYRLK